MFRKFLWTQLPCFAPEGDGAAPATPAAPAAPTGAEGTPAAAPETPAAGDTPATPAKVEGNGSLVPDGDTPAAEGDPATKPAEGEAAPPALDVAKLTLPEGMKADDPALGRLTEVLGDAKLSPQDRAQALLDTYKSAATEVATKAAEAVSAEYRRINDEWVAAVKADPEIGGANQSKALGVVAKALDSYGDGKALREVFAMTGAGNNPYVIKLIYNMATQLGEGRPAHGGTAAPRKSAAELFYPSSGDAAQQ